MMTGAYASTPFESAAATTPAASMHKTAIAVGRAMYVGLGANLGDARNTLQVAAAALQALPGIEQCGLSPFYRSAPVGTTGPDFVNAVIRLYTRLTPLALLDALQQIERQHHRQRAYRNSPRTLDLDLLYIEGVRLNSERLVVPHPRMHERAFVLRPLADLAPDLHLPHGSVQTLLARCGDQVIEPIE
jgi:2-amino-4-hydroxy-6-hydroxymethyldihydropteridine diphosphokinase